MDDSIFMPQEKTDQLVRLKTQIHPQTYRRAGLSYG
jgi:hypothetical protein